MTSDLALLQDYAQNKVQASFTALVNRHIHLVYSTALRQVRLPQLAEEVVQSVFTDLARTADKLKPNTLLTAWLYQVTRRTAIDVVRRESRRQLRERIASQINAMNSTADDWTRIEPLLDDAMGALDEADRTAILLRYFENKSLREVGGQLGVSDDAAQKRVSRAVDRLREFFGKREVRLGASGVAAVVSANAVQAAPPTLATTVSVAAVAGTATTIATQAATKTMNWITMKTGAAVVAAAVATGTGVYAIKHKEVMRLRDENLMLARGQYALVEERDAASARASDNLDRSNFSEDERSELLRLRGEVTRLHTQAGELARLRQANAELQTNLDARTAAANPTVDPLEQQKETALRMVKLKDGKTHTLYLHKFAENNDGWFPATWSAVMQYTNEFDDLSGFAEFELVYTRPFHENDLGTNWSRTVVVREIHAWPTYDGKRAKIYGFIDGHSQVVEPPDGNFAAWEAEHTFNPDWLPR